MKIDGNTDFPRTAAGIAGEESEPALPPSVVEPAPESPENAKSEPLRTPAGDESAPAGMAEASGIAAACVTGLPLTDDSLAPPTQIVELLPCPHCATPRSVLDYFCIECGFVFPAQAPAPAVAAASAADTAGLIRGRYRIGHPLGLRSGVERFAGTDERDPGRGRVPVIIVRQSVVGAEEALAEAAPQPLYDSVEEGPHSLDMGNLPRTARANHLPIIVWPSVEWERVLLERAEHLSLPRTLDHFQEAGYLYLVEECPPGRPVWEAWRDNTLPPAHRYGWLIQLAEALHSLHEAGAILPALRPEIVAITPTGQAVITDLRDLLPVPVPVNAEPPATFYTAPELLLSLPNVDPRADLYGFGALVYALILGRDLGEEDFTPAGLPRPFLERFPDIHPLIGRLVSKTFSPDVEFRFPADPSDTTAGVEELIHALDACRRNAGRVHLEIAAWTTTGMIRPGNEDAVAIHKSSEGRLDDADEWALLLLADGMGGVESGEIAAAIAVQTVRKFLLEEPPFCGIAQAATPVLRGPAPGRLLTAAVEELSHYEDLGSTVDVPSPLVWPGSLMLDPTGRESPLRGADAHQERLASAIREANRQVHQSASQGLGNRGMGCTLEAVLIDGSTVVVGHVGDSRVYQLSGGTMTQVTRDQTLVTRLVELGHITSEQAESHPRRSELQQAVGGRPDVFPDMHIRQLQPGDWLLICSDGLTAQLRQEVIQEILEASPSAELAARRLVNRANLECAVDNVSVIVVRAD